MIQDNENGNLFITLGEIVLVNYLIDYAKIGYSDIYTVSDLLVSFPKLANNNLNANILNQIMKISLSEAQLAWIKKELAKNLEMINIPARFATQCILLAQREVETEQANEIVKNPNEQIEDGE